MYGRWTWVAAALLGAGCGARLSSEIIANHPRVRVTVLEPQVVERSEALPPPWTRGPERGADAFVAFLGQSSAHTLDEAKKSALQDLAAAVSNFVAVDVETEFEDVSSEHTRDGATTSSQEVRSIVKTRSSARIEEIAPDSFYWERVASSPLATDDGSVRYYVHARVPKVEITRARARKLAERRETSGARTIVVLPFRPVLSTPDLAPLARAFAEELGRRLSGSPAVRVVDPDLVSTLLEGRNSSESLALETVRDGLLPDTVISGAYQLHAKTLRVTVSIHDGGTTKVLPAFDRDYEQLFQLEDLIAAALERELAIKTTQKVTTPISLQSFELYHAAFERHKSGDNAGAIALLRGVLEKSPGYGAAHLRLGRVLERIGSYGFVPPTAAPPDAERVFRFDPASCVFDADLSAARSGVETPPGRGRRDTLDVRKTSAAHENVDVLLSAIEFVVRGGRPPSLEIPAVATSALGAYFHAIVAAQQVSDVDLENEAFLAAADLASRVDRLDRAEAIYRALIKRAEATKDTSLLSLSLFGEGRVARIRSNFARAERLLYAALELRAFLGEKPYLLEIYNELGGLSVEAAKLELARVHFRQALRIADDLDDTYFRAVLENNLGVLEYLQGDAAAARIRFDRAFDHMKNIGEAEGSFAAGLNVAHLSWDRGELERARTYIREAARIVEATQQESRIAVLYEERARHDLFGSDTTASLRHLLRAWSIHHRLSRLNDLARTGSSLIAAQYYLLLESPTTRQEQRRAVSCLDDEMSRLTRGVEGIDSGNLGYLYMLLNAEALAGMTR